MGVDVVVVVEIVPNLAITLLIRSCRNGFFVVDGGIGVVFEVVIFVLVVVVVTIVSLVVGVVLFVDVEDETVVTVFAGAVTLVLVSLIGPVLLMSRRGAYLNGSAGVIALVVVSLFSCILTMARDADLVGSVGLTVCADVCVIPRLVLLMILSLGTGFFRVTSKLL